MKNIVKKINTLEINNISFDVKYIKLDELINLIYTVDEYRDNNKLDIFDIKDFNYKNKIILAMFISKHVNLYPLISRYNKYNYILFDDIVPLVYKTIFRGFFVSSDIIFKNQISRKYNKVLQVGILPTFLEAYLSIKESDLIKCDFIRVRSSKYETNTINLELYNGLIDTFVKKYGDYVNVYNIDKFYDQMIFDNKYYNLIIFDTYKNLASINLDDLPMNINDRYISSIIHIKYIYHQIIFAINKLEDGGDLILLFPGYDNVAYHQIMTILACLFMKTILYHSDMDYSYRYFVIAKGFKKQNKLVDMLTKNYLANINENFLINILSTDIKIIDTHFNKYLLKKFDDINVKMNNLSKYMNNEQLIKKMYYETYFNQLTNTKYWLGNIFGDGKINDKIYEIIYQYRLYLFDKLTKRQEYTFISKCNLDDKIEIVFDKIDKKVFTEICKPFKYLELFTLVGYDDINYTYDNYKSLRRKLLFDKNDTNTYEIFSMLKQIALSGDRNIIAENVNMYNKMLDHYKINNVTYVVWDYYIKTNINGTNLFEKLMNTIIINFNLTDISPLLVSTFYILANCYKKYKIIKTNISSEYYFVCENTNFTIPNKIIMIINKNLKHITESYLLVAISECFINEFNKIINKLLIKELLDVIRIKYTKMYNEYIAIHKTLLKKFRKH